MGNRPEFLPTEEIEYSPPPYIALSSILDGMKVGSQLQISTKAGKTDIFTIRSIKEVFDSYVVGGQWNNQDVGEVVSSNESVGAREKIVKEILKYNALNARDIYIVLTRNGKKYNLALYGESYYIWPTNGVPGIENRNQVAQLERVGNRVLIQRMIRRVLNAL